MTEDFVTQEEADAPQWELAGRVHEWRNYVGERTRRIWDQFTPEQRFAIANDAQAKADWEQWD